METYFSFQPLVAVTVSLLASALIVFSGPRPNLREAWTILAALVKFGVTLSMLPAVLSGRYPAIVLFDVSPGISLALRVDTLGILFGLSASLLWILTSFYSIGYVRGLVEHKQTRYFASFAVCLSATMGVAFAANLLTFVIFYELLTIATYPLVVHKETPAAIAAGRKYLAYLLTGGLALTVAVAFTLGMTGALDFAPGGFLSVGAGRERLLALFLLFTIGFGVKSALMPLHSWLPTAMIAPTPVSALLHAVAVVKVGVFGFARVIGFVFGPALLQEIGAAGLLTAICVATILLASLLALRQDNLKARLAYSTVGHLSYIVLGMTLLTPTGWIGGLFHIVSHAVTKITLFFCAGAIYVKTHRENVSELNGIGKQMPLTLGAFALASMGLAGVPPISGFISKWYLGLGALQAGEPILLAVLLLSGLLNAAYLLPIVVRAFLGSSKQFQRFDEVSLWMLLPLLSTAALSLALGLFPDGALHFYSLASEVAASVIGGGGQ